MFIFNQFESKNQIRHPHPVLAQDNILYWVGSLCSVCAVLHFLDQVKNFLFPDIFLLIAFIWPQVYCKQPNKHITIIFTTLENHHHLRSLWGRGELKIVSCFTSYTWGAFLIYVCFCKQTLTILNVESVNFRAFNNLIKSGSWTLLAWPQVFSYLRMIIPTQ